jgi:recombination protein RecT
MTAQTVTAAAEEQSRDLKLINWLRAQQDDLAMAAASHLKPATIVRVAQGALRKDPKLMAAAIANPQSLLYCLLDAARLGHEAGTDQYWLIPFGQEVTGIEGYKGVIERMYRAGGVSTVHAEVVRQKDVYRGLGSRQPPVHEYDEFADEDDRGPLRGVYAYAIMADGTCSQVIRAGKAEVMKHKAVSRGSDRADSPWQKWPVPMWKKVPLSALEPYVPTSSEWLMTRARAEATAQGRPVITQGWAPPIPAAAAAAPRQLVAGSVEPQDVPPAGEQPSPPAAQADPVPAPPGPAGGTPGDERHKALVGVAQQHFRRLGYADADKQDRLRHATDLVLGTEVPAVSSFNDLTHGELEDLNRIVERLKDRAALNRMLKSGEVNGE